MFDRLLQGLALKWVSKNKEKMLKGAATAAVAYIAGLSTQKLGVPVTPEQQVVLEGLVMSVTAGAIIAISNALKQKYPALGKYI